MYTDLKVWLDHFDYHSTRPCVMPEGKRLGLQYDERQLIAGSLTTFLRWSRIESEPLLRAATIHAGGDASSPLPKIVSLLIAERQHHADLLGAFIHQHGLTTAEQAARRNGLFQSDPSEDFETQLATLATADLIGKVYLRALEAATGCRQLRGLCRMLVADQLAHVGFESDLLRSIHASRTPVIRGAHALAFRAHFTAASLSAWIAHRPVLEAAEYCVSTFIRACNAQYTFYLEPPMKSIAPVVYPPLQ